MRSEHGLPRRVGGGLESPSLALDTALQDCVPHPPPWFARFMAALVTAAVEQRTSSQLEARAATDPCQRELVAVLVRKLQRISAALDELQRCDPLPHDGPGHRFRLVRSVVDEVIADAQRALEARGIGLFVREPLPEVHVDARRLSLVPMTILFE